MGVVHRMPPPALGVGGPTHILVLLLATSHFGGSRDVGVVPLLGRHGTLGQAQVSCGRGGEFFYLFLPYFFGNDTVVHIVFKRSSRHRRPPQPRRHPPAPRDASCAGDPPSGRRGTRSYPHLQTD
eukprot:948298-Prymnesium_polylepis.1